MPWNSQDSLYHHGILGQKWGVRRYQNEDGTLTAAGERRYAKSIKKAEKKAVNSNPRNKGVWRPFRDSTGENFDKAVKDFHDSFKNDKEYKKLSKQAYELEKKRLMMEKPYTDDEDGYDKLMQSKAYQKAWEDSDRAAQKKDAYVANKAKEYIDVIKEAKVKDLGFTDNMDVAKKYVSSKWTDKYYWDENLEYNPDNYYESWVDKETFK